MKFLNLARLLALLPLTLVLTQCDQVGALFGAKKPGPYAFDLVLNEDLNNAYFLDAHYRSHTQAIKPEARPVIELAAQRKKASEAMQAAPVRRSVLLA